MVYVRVVITVGLSYITFFYFHRYVNFYKEGVDTVERYPVMVLEEIHAYSVAVSQYFSVKEIYSQVQFKPSFS